MAGTPCYVPLFLCLILSLGNREFGQSLPLCSHLPYLFISCALCASVIPAFLLFFPVRSIPIPARWPWCFLCSWRGILSRNSSHGFFSSQPSEIALPSPCPFTTICHYAVDHSVFVSPYSFPTRAGTWEWFLLLFIFCVCFCFVWLYFSLCCVTPTALNSTR